MKQRLLIGLVAMCMLLSGCSTWFDGSYVAVRPHTPQNYIPEYEVVAVSTYLELREAIISMVSSGVETGFLSVSGFTQGELSEQMDKAITYILRRDPLSNYAVNRINYEIGTVAGVETAAVRIWYRHGAAEIQKMKKASNMSDVSTLIGSALSQCETKLLIKVTDYRNLDYEQVVENYTMLHPDIVVEQPQIVVTEYPNTGTKRVIEILFNYVSTRETLRAMQGYVQPVFSSSALYVMGEEEASIKYSLLYAFLMERNGCRVETSITPCYSLLRHGVGDHKAFATVYAAMCRRANLECYTVSGTKNGEPWYWNIVSCEDGYRHVDLLQSYAAGGFLTYTDDQMQGYVWDYSAYPACTTPAPPITPDGTQSAVGFFVKSPKNY